MSTTSDIAHRGAWRARCRSIGLSLAVLLVVFSGGRAYGQSNEIFVSNYAANTISVYSRTTNGDVIPTRTIQSGLNQPHTLGVDFLQRELFVPNNLTSAQGAAVHVYDLTASSPGNDAPKRTIAGALTGLDRPAGLFVDSIHQELYVANDIDTAPAVLVFALSANGNVAPLRTIQGPTTGLLGPLGVAIDFVHDELYVVNYKVVGDGSITVFPRTAAGDVAPLRTIQGPTTGFNRPQGIAVDAGRNEIIVANSFFGTASPGNVLVFSRLATGDAAPLRQIAGPTTALCNPIGLALDLVNDEIVVSNSHASSAACATSVAAFARTANGDAAPLRRIGPGPLSALNNPEGVTVVTTVDCSSPAVAQGSPCDDGNVCTPLDTCQSGTCVGGGSVTCVPSDQCHSAGTCNPVSGCTNPPRADGSSCNDGNLCTQSDSCQGGVCSGSNPVVCSPSDVCHLAGTCVPATGVCSVGPAVQCVASDQCHDVGVCDPSTGCSNPPKANGAACSDGYGCTQPDTCQAGSCVSGPMACATDEMYVSNYSTNQLTVYARTANGDVAPIRTVQTGLDHPHTLGVDRLRQEIYVTNNLVDTSQPAVNVYDEAASYPGSDTPKRTIVGPLTGLNRPAGLLVDTIHQELYVANDLDTDSSVRVFALGATGNVAPLRTLQGALTGLVGPMGMAVDVVHDELFVVSYKVSDGGSISVFPRNANGNVAPTRLIQGPLTTFNLPQGIALDQAHGEIIVADSALDSNSIGELLVFSRLDSGNIAPLRRISGPDTAACNPIGLVLDAVNDEVVVANSHFGTAACAESVSTYARTAVGDALPLRQVGPGPASLLTHPASVAIKTHVDCADPSIADGTLCDDGNACTTLDRCHGGLCVPGAPVVCALPDGCHQPGVCDPGTGLCSNPQRADGSSCNDGNACTQNDVCTSGVCGGSAITCNDNNPCTDDSCNPASGCVFANNHAACNDGNACTAGDVCNGGTCSGTPIVCNDSNPCTDDSCNPASGCTFVIRTGACDDGNACTSGDTCVSGVCVGTPVTCNDNNPCTDDSCNPASGCVFAPNTNACDDGSVCTTGDHCSGGSCVGTAIVCDDGNPCTTDSCNPVTGCSFVNNTIACDDGDACTANDRCSGGVCVGNPVLELDEVDHLMVTKTAATRLTWAALGGTAYDVASSTLSDLRTNGTVTATCAANDLKTNSFNDTRPAPASGDGFYYLVRAQLPCVTGTYGFNSAGQERSLPAACP